MIISGCFPVFSLIILSHRKKLLSSIGHCNQSSNCQQVLGLPEGCGQLTQEFPSEKKAESWCWTVGKRDFLSWGSWLLPFLNPKLSLSIPLFYCWRWHVIVITNYLKFTGGLEVHCGSVTLHAVATMLPRAEAAWRFFHMVCKVMLALGEGLQRLSEDHQVAAAYFFQRRLIQKREQG